MEKVSNVDLERLQKVALGIVPVLSAAAFIVGIVYDAAWFWAIGAGFYALFSLSEHVIFALQVIPSALTFIVVSFMFITMKSERGTKENLFIFCAAALLFMFCGMFIYYGNYWAVGVTIFWVFYILLVIVSTVGGGLFAKMIGGFIALCMFSFMHGYFDGWGTITRHPLNYEITLHGGSTPVKGIFMKGGSAGALYLDDQRKVTFRKWDGIVSVVRVGGSFIRP
jgi:hypothetical protein